MPGKHKNRKSYADPERPSGRRLTERERAQILALYSIAKWNRARIARELKIAHSTVRSAIRRGFCTPPPKPSGRPPILTTRKRRRLVQRATLDAFHRRLSYEEIAKIEGINVCRRSLFTAFEKEKYHRRAAQEKPLLTEAHMAARLQWAKAHENWDINMWKRVAWTDAASFTTGVFGKIFVTRTAEEKYNHDCLVPKFAGYSSAMAYGSISAVSKGPLILMNKDWGKVNSQVYTHRVLPAFYQHIREIERTVGFMRGILMEDNASIHTSQYTRGYHAYHGIIRMVWPAHSPDLNPIENVWRLLKYRIGKRFPKTDAEVRQYLLEEWDKMEVQDFMKYIESMPERCKAVIAANGGHTK